MLLVYKRARYIRTALESVLAQTYTSWRAVIWDNGPGSDEIRSQVEDLLVDTRVTYHATGQERQLAANWTAALAHGTATYVALLSDDDYWLPTFLESRVRALDAKAECGFAFSECERVDAEGHVFFQVPFRLREGVISRDILADRLCTECIVTPSTLLARRAAFDAVGAAWDGRWRYSDWEMVARLAAAFPAYYLKVHDNATRTHAYRETTAAASDPDELLAMSEHIDALFARSVPGYPTRSAWARRRGRAVILLRSAHDSYVSGGWLASRRLYLRALREYPPLVFTATSLVIVGERLLGRRLLDAARSVRHSLRRRMSRPLHKVS